MIELAVTLEEVPGKGWVASAPEVRATAQGETEKKALENLRELLRKYPELLNGISQPPARRVQLLTV
jgi:predicted RNase H-like HicB family nuclease